MYRKYSIVKLQKGDIVKYAVKSVTEYGKHFFTKFSFDILINGKDIGMKKPLYKGFGNYGIPSRWLFDTAEEAKEYLKIAKKQL